jgi:hypothetical protein
MTTIINKKIINNGHEFKSFTMWQSLRRQREKRKVIIPEKLSYRISYNLGIQDLHVGRTVGICFFSPENSPRMAGGESGAMIQDAALVYSL